MHGTINTYQRCARDMFNNVGVMVFENVYRYRKCMAGSKIINLNRGQTIWLFGGRGWGETYGQCPKIDCQIMR